MATADVQTTGEAAAAAKARLKVAIVAEPFEIEREIEDLIAGSDDVGAVATFSGYCRSEGGALAALEIEHYPGMADEEIARILRKAAGRWPLTGLAALHRHGLIRPGEPIVLVAAASRHRSAAFEAASFVMDFLKTSAPFWKKEHRSDGTVGDWVEAQAADDGALERWG